MTSKDLVVRQPYVYYRNTQNDLPEKTDKSDSLLLRIVSAALPIVSLYKPVQYLFQNGLSFTRFLKNAGEIINSYSEGKYYELTKDFFDISFSIASLSAGVFANAYGLFFSTLHDVGLNSYDCIKLLSDDSYTHLEFLKRIMNTTSSCLYLVAMFYGCLEGQVASLSVLLITELVSTFREYTKGKERDWLQVLSYSIMAVARGYQLVPQVKNLQKKWAFEKAMKAYLTHFNRIYVGDLQEKWQFPSDHLPIENEIDGTQIISWNVLNTKYMDWVYNDSQGLKGSMLTQLDILVEEKNGLTQRDLVVIDMINKMASKSNGIISLQECGAPFLNELEKQLPKNWQMVKSSQKPIPDQNVILFNTDYLSYSFDQSEISKNAYPCNPGRSLMNCLFQRSDGKDIRIINSHLPGNPALPGRYEFCEYIKKHAKEDEITIAMGDMNFEKHEVQEACNKQGLMDAFVVSPDYGTNVDPCREAKTIDHMIVMGTKNIESLSAEEVIEGLDKTASLVPVYG